ncbi:tubby-related protein 4-like isoform X1 [Branchiostoma floridae x Branchiostoma japonicum]
MHARLEHAPVARSDSTIHTLSWNGIIPASEREKSVARRRYCHEGWLATGNAKGVVGATFTTSHCRKEYKAPPRSNFNLRGHNSEVVLVRWNEPYQKLATCDGNGVIFVWIKYEGRWSIELVNDRGSPVSDFNWSHDGRLALICYRDGFVLVGSVAGQRYWSSMLNLEESNILCGVWTPDDKQVLFGTADGQVIVMDSHGAMVAQCILDDDDEIRSLAWSGEKFHMVNTSDSESEVEESPSTPKQKGQRRRHSQRQAAMKSGHILAVGFGSGDVALMKSYDDMAPVLIRTNMIATKLEWSSCGLFLAVGGTHRHITDPDSVSAVKYYDTSGHLRFTLNIPAQRALTAMTWGHNDKRFFVASGSSLFVAWVEKEVAPLQLLCMEVVGVMIKEEKQVARLPLPSRIKNYVTQAFSPTIKQGCIPDPSKLREFVSQTSVGAERLHCTMVRTDDDGYTLYLEYLGGLVPLLKGKKVSKLRPEFVIFDPEVCTKDDKSDDDGGIFSGLSSSGCSSGSDFSDNDSDELQSRRRSPGQLGRKGSEKERDTVYLDNLPQENRLVEVTSNIWGTKFKVHGLAPFLPAYMGAVNYKTSLLHLQPRQMTIYLPEIGKGIRPPRDTTFNPNMFSEDEEEGSPGCRDSGISNVEPPPEEMDVPICPVSCADSLRSVKKELLTTRMNLANEDIFSSANQITLPGKYFVEVHHGNSEVHHGSGVEVQRGRQEAQCIRPDCYERRELSPSEREQYISQGAIPKAYKSVEALNKNLEDLDGETECDGEILAAEEPQKLLEGGVVTNGDGGVANEMFVDGELEGERWAKVATEIIEPSSVETSLFSDDGDETKVFSEGASLTLAPRENRCRRLGMLSSAKTSIISEKARQLLATPKNSLREPSRGPPSPKMEPEDIFEPRESIARKANQTLDKHVSIKLTERPGSPREIESNASRCRGPYEDRVVDKGVRGIAEGGKLIHQLCTKCNKSHGVKGQKVKFRSRSQAEQSSDSEGECNLSGDELGALRTKGLTRRKSKRVRSRSEGDEIIVQHEYVLTNKAPLWNESTQVYQLDFGGRVTQESAKNFQVELEGQQVLQFGRIDVNAYTLDFQHPFTALQAFAVALANVTQRLK